MVSLCFIYIHSQMVLSYPLRYEYIFSPTALNKLLHPWKSNKHKLQFLQQLQCSSFHKTRLNFCYFTSMLPFTSFQQLTINGFQVTPILEALFFSIVLYHKLLKMIFFFIVFFFFFLSYMTSSLDPQSG